MSPRRNEKQNQNIKINNMTFENVVKFRYSCFGTIMTNQNLVYKEIKSGINSDNILYNSDHFVCCCLKITD
jgi:hypothetical protein